MLLNREKLSVAVRIRVDKTFPKVGQVNSAAGRAPETEAGEACPVARMFNEEDVTVLLEEVSVAVK
jgi:hypothetical protein